MSLLISWLHLRQVSSALSVSEYSKMCKNTQEVKIKLHSLLAPFLSIEMNGLFHLPTPFPGETTADFIGPTHILKVN